MKLRTFTLIRRFVFTLAALALLLMLPQPAPAAYRYWVADTGDWDNGGFWSDTYGGIGGAGQPQDGDRAYLASNGSTSRIVYYHNTAYPDAVLTELVISATGTGTMTLRQGDYSDGQVLASDYEFVGRTGTGTHFQSKGSNTIHSLTLGFYSSDSGTYELTGGVLTAPFELIGRWGNGTFIQSGGSNKGDGDIILGEATSSTGVYTLTGGTIRQKNEFIGWGGTGAFTQSGGTNNVAETLSIAEYAGSSGVYNLQGGTLNAGTINLNSGGIFNQAGGSLLYTTFNQQGGEVQGDLENRGTFNYYSGFFTGRLLNYGAVNFAADFTASRGMANYSEFTIPNGRTITLNGPGLNNSGSLILAGGTLRGSGPLVNQATLSGYGTIAGSGGFFNLAFFSQDGGNLTLSTTGTNENHGNMFLAQGRLFTLGSGVTLTNRGTIDLNLANINGDGALENTYGGVISGPGTISSDFTNAGGILAVGSGTTYIPKPFSNNGLIQLTDFTANLTGGAFTNSRTVQGYGNVGNNITNSGIIEALGGTLTLSGSILNNSGSLMTAGTGNKLLITRGLSSNDGVINLTGGTFDNNDHTLNNANQISGYGTFRAARISNSGTITLSGGTTTVNGDIANGATGHLNIAYNPAIFTGNVTNQGVVKVTHTTVTWAGTFINSGAYISDPSDNYFTDLVIGSTGYLTGGTGDRWFISNDFINQSTQNNLWNTRLSDLAFTSGGDNQHDLYLPGQDRGIDLKGYNQNFSWGKMDLTDQILSLFDGNTETGGAQYVGAILGVLFHGLKVDNISGNGFNIYYNASLAENAYLNGQTYALMDGGYLMATAPVPLPASAWLFLSGLAGLGLLGRKKKQQNMED